MPRLGLRAAVSFVSRVGAVCGGVAPGSAAHESGAIGDWRVGNKSMDRASPANGPKVLGWVQY